MPNYGRVHVVAEIGATHVGSIERAKTLINLAALCGADFAKFQKRNPHESVPEEIKHKPHPNQRFSYGATYLEHRLALEFSILQHAELKSYCEEKGIKYATSVWDLTSAKEVVTLNPEYIKIPSACNMNWALLEFLSHEFTGDIHISTGMITPEERENLYSTINQLGIKDRVVLYHCTSEYPCPFEHLYLLEIERLAWAPCRQVGFSNHGFGIASDVVSYMLGARWIERHFIDDRTFRHTDAAASLEPDGLRRLCRDLRMIPKCLNLKTNLSTEEREQRSKLRV